MQAWTEDVNPSKIHALRNCRSPGAVVPPEIRTTLDLTRASGPVAHRMWRLSNFFPIRLRRVEKCGAGGGHFGNRSPRISPHFRGRFRTLTCVNRYLDSLPPQVVTRRPVRGQPEHHLTIVLATVADRVTVAGWAGSTNLSDELVVAVQAQDG